MSFRIGTGPGSAVTFRLPGGMEADRLSAPPGGFTYLLDIDQNTYPRFEMLGRSHLAIMGTSGGNFSRWIDVAPNEAVAVSGLASCAAIFVASHDFGKMAAGHMSGEAQFVKDWIDVLAETPSVKPEYMVFATGTEGSPRDGDVLMAYMKAFGLQETPVRAPAIKGCGSALVCRGATSGAIVHARRNSESLKP